MLFFSLGGGGAGALCLTGRPPDPDLDDRALRRGYAEYAREHPGSAGCDVVLMHLAAARTWGVRIAAGAPDESLPDCGSLRALLTGASELRLVATVNADGEAESHIGEVSYGAFQVGVIHQIGVSLTEIHGSRRLAP